MTSVHDAGAGVARARAERAHAGAETLLEIQGGARIRFGTASWTDPTLLTRGVFYPDDVRTPEQRLRHYASIFPLVEVDSTYYALPARRIAEHWVERTPDHFMFDVKAHALMTGQPSEVERLPAALRFALPAALRDRARIYAKDLPLDLRVEIWRTFIDALEPLRLAGKLGAVLLQYPRWFLPNRVSAAAIEEARSLLGDLPAAVEFRHGSWLSERLRDRTMKLLNRHAMTYVNVDTPQGMASSVPGETAVTVPRLAVVRLHGRRTETWERPVRVVSERYRYLYEESELWPLAARVAAVAKEAEEVHVLFNNCYANYGTTNALELAAMVSHVYRAGDGGRVA
jgi:uncharacterized protein YecE (DUF72 family)